MTNWDALQSFVGHAALEAAGDERDGEEDREIDERDHRIDLERPIGVGADQRRIVDESGTAMTDTSEVFFSWVIAWLT